MDWGGVIDRFTEAFTGARNQNYERKRQTQQDYEQSAAIAQRQRIAREQEESRQLAEAVRMRKDGLRSSAEVERFSRLAPVTGAVVRDLQGQEVQTVDPERYSRVGSVGGQEYYLDQQATPEAQRAQKLGRIGDLLRANGAEGPEMDVLTSPYAAEDPSGAHVLADQVGQLRTQRQNRAAYDRIREAYPGHAGEWNPSANYGQLEQKLGESAAMEQDLRRAGYSPQDARVRARYGVDPQPRRISAEREDRLSTSSQRAAYKPTAKEQTDAKAYTTRLLAQNGNDPTKALQALQKLGDLSDAEELVRAELVDLQAAKQRRAATGEGAVPSWMR
jgi:hypothetical protein